MSLPAMLAPFCVNMQKVITVDLSAPLTNVVLDLGTMTLVGSLEVTARSGAGTASIKWNVPGATGVDYGIGRILNGLAVNALIITSDGAGGSITYSLQGV